MRILVVDDVRDNADTLAMFLQVRGHSVTTAFTEAAAMALLEHGGYDAAVIDWQLAEGPGEHGGDGTRILKWMRVAGDMTPVALVTAHGQQELAACELAVKMFPKAQAMRKPFDPEALLAALESMRARP